MNVICNWQEVVIKEKIDVNKSILAIKKLVDETKEGKSVREIVSSTAPKEIEEIQCIETQMAIVAAVEKLGHAKVTQDILIEQLNSDRIGLLNTVGTKALSTILQKKAYGKNEIMTYFQPEDFKTEQVKERVAQILNFAQEMNQTQVEQEIMQDLTINVNRFIFQRDGI